MYDYSNPYAYTNPYANRQVNNPSQSRRSYDRGYARDAAKEQILGRLERLMDDATNETDRMAIEDCINKIEQ